MSKDKSIITKFYKNEPNTISYLDFISQEIDYQFRVADNEDCYEIVPYTPEIGEDELLQFLHNTDNYALRLSTGEAKEDDYSETYQMTFKQIMDKRKEVRDKLKELEG